VDILGGLGEVDIQVDGEALELELDELKIVRVIVNMENPDQAFFGVIFVFTPTLILDVSA